MQDISHNIYFPFLFFKQRQLWNNDIKTFLILIFTLIYYTLNKGAEEMWTMSDKQKEHIM